MICHEEEQQVASLQCQGAPHIMGIAVLARMAFQGTDLAPLRARLLDRVARNEHDAGALLDLSTVLQLTGNPEDGLIVQRFALQKQQCYRVGTLGKPAAVRLLSIVAPGDLAQNNVVEFLVEGSDVSLDLLYVARDLPFPSQLPEHDVAMVSVSESDRNHALLEAIEALVQRWPKPVICRPDHIARSSRDLISKLLRTTARVVSPATVRVDRRTLECISRSELAIGELLKDTVFPIIVRPVDSQKGQGLKKLDAADAFGPYLSERPERTFYMAPFVDYSSEDGLFRKYRVVMISGRPYACHMAVSDRWMVHYVDAGMFESASKRAEEAKFFAEFDNDFGSRHHDALVAIANQVRLEYFGIDCSETRDGKLLVFEIDSAMTVHAMDPVDVFPYKQPQMCKVFQAFRQLVLSTQQSVYSGAKAK